MSSSREFLWLVRCLEDKCPIFGLKHNLENLKIEIKRGAFKDPTSSCNKFVTSQEPYAQVAGAFFRENPSKGVIPILQAHGYFNKGNKKLFATNPRPKALLPLFECLMWAYLDTCLPKNEISKVIGRTKTTSCSDAESTLCVWINTIVKRHIKLPVLSNITQHFFEMPHFRMVLYHFTHDEPLFNINQSSEENASISLRKATELGLEPPFEITDCQQPPLVIMCYLCRVATFLSDVKPPPLPPVITNNAIHSMLVNIENTKKEIAAAEIRVKNLTTEVDCINETLKRISRPQSMLTMRNPNRHPVNAPENGFAASMRAQSSLSGKRRVTWDIPEETLQRMAHSPKKNMGGEKYQRGLTKREGPPQPPK
ncbi:hypothetical protein TRFO_06275 [Tritrichomonas foetus]|uniref:Uncharacterized protein n=1 Tax=Tritrichomonas foetus TaxID=1144522 RepID=A0A1J4K0U4_9EUKA|nr:hypothetical protein TRFO_06275 [Tritrichomonas foetus]|eukprot:OHT04400.1 hypothetical protein TRFO_06275 [Tritrichomonas foetus]